MEANRPSAQGAAPSTGISGVAARAELERRRRLLEAVADCCAERGYQGTSVAQIIERAGVSRREFDRLFRDKEDCFLAAANAILGDLLTAATSAYSPDKPLYQVVSDAAKGILELMAAKPAFASLAFVDYRTATPRAAGLYQSGVRVLISLLDQMRIDSAHEAPLPSSAARGAIGGAEALLRNEVAAGRAEQLPKILPQIVYSCLVPFLGCDGALERARLAVK